MLTSWRIVKLTSVKKKVCTHPSFRRFFLDYLILSLSNQFEIIQNWWGPLAGCTAGWNLSWVGACRLRSRSAVCAHVTAQAGIDSCIFLSLSTVCSRFTHIPPGSDCRAWWRLGHKHALGATALEACPHRPAAALGFPPARPQKSAKICSELCFNVISGRFAEVGL